VPSLQLLGKDGSSVAEFRPLAASVIGASGRVDMIGAAGAEFLVYLAESGPVLEIADSSANKPVRRHAMFTGVSKPGWYWIGERRLGRAHALDRNLLLDLLRSVSDHDVR
jgi:hypothetical protein